MAVTEDVLVRVSRYAHHDRSYLAMELLNVVLMVAAGTTMLIDLGGVSRSVRRDAIKDDGVPC
jgi:hypothetical protein